MPHSAIQSSLFLLDKLTSRHPRFVKLLAVFVLTFLFLAGHSVVFAQLPSPKLQALRPAGGQRGSQLEVTLRGAELDEASGVIFTHPGITAEQKTTPATDFEPEKKSNDTFVVKIADNVPLGIYEARFVGRFGVSNPRRFVVGDLAEVLSDGANRNVNSPRELPLNTVYNGQVEANQLDWFKLSLQKGERVIIACRTESIDSKMDASLAIFNLAGEELQQARSYNKRDCVLDFTPAIDAQYLLSVQDFVFSGGPDLFYRLTASQRPHIDFILPPAVAAGAEAEITLYGRRLPGGQPTDFKASDGQPLEMLKTKVTVPAEAAQLDPNQRTASIDPVLTNLQWFDYRLPADQGGSNSVPLFVAKAPVQLEAEPNDSGDMPQVIEVPCEVAGQFYPTGDVDWVEFAAKAGDVLMIDVVSQQMALYTDPIIEVYQVEVAADGKENLKKLQTVDDPGDREARIGTDFDTSTDDPLVRFQAPADAKYRIAVSNQFATSYENPAAVYRLIIRPELPDFDLLAFPVVGGNGTQVTISSLVVRKGGTEKFDLKINRRDGFQGEVEVSVEGLPEGVTAQPAVISNNQNQIPIIISATEQATAWHGPIKIIGKSKVGDREIIKQAWTGTIVWDTANRAQNLPIFRTNSQLFVSVCSAETLAAFAEVGAPQVYETSIGGKLELPIKVVRRNEFAGELKLKQTALPGQFKLPEVTIPGDKQEATLVIELKDKATPLDVYTFCLEGDVKFKYSQNPDAVRRGEEEQKRLDEKIAEFTAKLNETNAKLNVAKQELQTVTNQVNQTKPQVDAATTSLKQQQEVLVKKQAELKQAQDAAAADAANEALKKTVTDKEKEVADAQAAAVEAEKKLAELSKAFAELEKKLAQATTDVKTHTDAAAVDQNAVNQFTNLKKTADQVLTNAKNANNPKDVTFKTYSTPIRLRVVASPIKIEAVTDTLETKVGTDQKVTVKIARNYGFAGDVQLVVNPPNGVAGIAADAVTIPAAAVDGEIVIKVAENAPPGDHTCTLIIKGKFNDVDVETQTPIKLKTLPKTE